MGEGEEEFKFIKGFDPYKKDIDVNLGVVSLGLACQSEKFPNDECIVLVLQSRHNKEMEEIKTIQRKINFFE